MAVVDHASQQLLASEEAKLQQADAGLAVALDMPPLWDRRQAAAASMARAP